MSVSIRSTLAVFLGLLIMAPASADAALALNTVNWAADSSVDGTGTGTLISDALNITVTYTTAVAGNAGMTLPFNWAGTVATAGAAPNGVTYATGGVLGTTTGASPVLQTISFSGAITDPILLFQFADALTTINLGSLTYAVLSSNNAAFAGPIVTFPGAGNLSSDGMGLQLTGTFGPGTPITFLYSTTNPASSPLDWDTIGFTVGSNAVPEPSSIVMALTGAVIAAGMLRRARRRSVTSVEVIDAV